MTRLSNNRPELSIEDLNSKVTVFRQENTGANILMHVTGAIHTGLMLAAEAVKCTEASIVSKMSKGQLSYEELKEYRDIKSNANVMITKAKVKQYSSRIKEFKAKQQMSNSNPQTV